MSLKHRWHDAGPYSRHGVMAPESLREAGMIEPVFEGCGLEADRRETDKRDPEIVTGGTHMGGDRCDPAAAVPGAFPAE